MFVDGRLVGFKEDVYVDMLSMGTGLIRCSDRVVGFMIKNVDARRCFDGGWYPSIKHNFLKTALCGAAFCLLTIHIIILNPPISFVETCSSSSKNRSSPCFSTNHLHANHLHRIFPKDSLYIVSNFPYSRY